MNQKKKTSNFLNTYHLKNIVKQRTCFKNPDKPTCIDLIHKFLVIVLKLYFSKQKRNIQIFRDYKRFQNDLFWSDLIMSYQSLMYETLNLSNF